MEFNGDEKRIQALFSELALEHQSRTPGFAKLWLRAETSVPVPVLVNTRFAAVFIAVAFVAVCVIATSSWYRSSQLERTANIPPQIIPTTSEPSIKNPEQFLSANSRELSTIRPGRVRQRQTERAAIREAAVLSNWQSPTNILLNSPATSFLSSLPQLNQSARDLEQFLPKNNDATKESKQ